MANKNLANATSTRSMVADDYILLSQGGSVRKITLEDFQESLNEGNSELLHEVAWGVPIKQNQSSPDWGFVGNSMMKQEYFNNIGRYFLTNDGKMAKLSVQDSSVFADGTELDETKGHVVFYSPRLYYLVKEDAQTGIPTLWMSQLPIGGHYIEESCFGAYMGNITNNALVSRSGVKPTGAKSINAFWTAAQVNGKNFGLANYEHQKLMIMLNLMKYGNPDCQKNIGYGVAGSVSKDLWATAANFLTGATKSLGDECGKVDIEVVKGDVTGVDCSRVNLFGIEDAWGWLWEMRQGIYFGSTDKGHAGTEVFLYQGNRMPSTEELASHPEGDYRQLTRLTTNGYVKTMTLGEFFDIIPKQIGGGSTSYWADYLYGNSIGQLGLWGGYSNYGTYAGLGYAYSGHAWSYTYANVGSRLAYYGPIKKMSGAELMASI